MFPPIFMVSEIRKPSVGANISMSVGAIKWIPRYDSDQLVVLLNVC